MKFNHFDYLLIDGTDADLGAIDEIQGGNCDGRWNTVVLGGGFSHNTVVIHDRYVSGGGGSVRLAGGQVTSGTNDGRGNVIGIGNNDGLNVVNGGRDIDNLSTAAVGAAAPAGNPSANLATTTAVAGTVTVQSIGISITDAGNGDGNSNTVSIGNEDGVNIVIDDPGGTLTAAATSTSPAANAATTTTVQGGFGGDWFGTGGQSLLQQGGTGTWSSPFGTVQLGADASFDQIAITAANCGNNDGNNNTVAIGNLDGINVTSGTTAALASSAASQLVVGSDDGNGNTVTIGNQDGVNLIYGASSDPTPAAAGSAPSITFECITINVSNSGNSDGNGNVVVSGVKDGTSGGSGVLSGTVQGGVGSNDGDNNAVSIGDQNGVNISLGSNSGIVIGEICGAVRGYWLEDGNGHLWYSRSEADLMQDITGGAIPSLTTTNFASVTFENASISVTNSGNGDGNGNSVYLGSQDGIHGASGGSLSAVGGTATVGSYDGNTNAVSIGNTNGINLFL